MGGTGTAEPDGDVVVGADGVARCWWAAATPQLARYHDTEWGRGPHDEPGLFERLCLEAFQAGLSWRLVLERRAALRTALDGFEPARLAARDPADVDVLLAAPGMIRNRAKVTAVLANARVLVRLHADGTGLGPLTEEVLAAVPPPPRPAPVRRTDVPAATATSAALARRLRDAGWRFVGPTTAYAYLQAGGWVDDHLAACAARRAPSEPPGARAPRGPRGPHR